MNQLYDNKNVTEIVDLSEQDFTSLTRATIKNNYVNTDMTQGRRLGYVLQKVEPEKDTGWWDSLFENPTPKYFVRIPELDAHLPQPMVIGEEAKKTRSKRNENSEDQEMSDQSIIEMHELFEPKSDGDTIPKLEAGDRVWVTKSNGNNIILESLKSPKSEKDDANVPSPKGSKGAPFINNSRSGPLRGNISIGEAGLHPSLANEKDLPIDTAKAVANHLINLKFSETEAANILAMIHGDSGFVPNSEMNFADATLERTKNHWGALLNPLTDDEIIELKKDYVKFYDWVYYGPSREEATNSTMGDNGGGHEFRGRGFVHFVGKGNYKEVTKYVPGLEESKENLLDPQYAIVAAGAFYKFVVPENKRGYDDFLKVYSATKWDPYKMSETPSKAYYIEDFEKRKKWAAGWLDYVKRNITFSLGVEGDFQLEEGSGQYEVDSEEDKLAEELHLDFLSRYIPELPNLQKKLIVPMEEGAGKQIDLDPIELSTLPQYPILPNGYNFITPLIGRPGAKVDGSVRDSAFWQNRGTGISHCAIDQFVPDNVMDARIRAQGPGRVSMISTADQFDAQCIAFQGEMLKGFYNNRWGTEGANRLINLRNKGETLESPVIKACLEHSKITPPSNYGQMKWRELKDYNRTCGYRQIGPIMVRLLSNWKVPNAPLKGKFAIGGAGLSITYDADHNGVVYLGYYGHLSHNYVNYGDRVEAGQIIGTVGDTCVFDDHIKHLHFSFETKGYNKDTHPVPDSGWGYYNPKKRIPPRTVVPAMAINIDGNGLREGGDKHKGVYSAVGKYKELQTMKVVPKPESFDSPYKKLEPYTENRVRIDDGYEPIRDRGDSRLVDVPSVPSKGQLKLHVLAAARFQALILDAADAGFEDVRLASAHRFQKYKTFEEYKKAMGEIYPDKSFAEARRLIAFKSAHMTGLALDFGTHGLEPKSSTKPQQYQTDFFKWLKENAHYYGLTPYKYEPWHWEVKVPLKNYESGEEFTQDYQVYVEELATDGGDVS